MDGHSVECFSRVGDKALTESLGSSKFSAQQPVHMARFPYQWKNEM